MLDIKYRPLQFKDVLGQDRIKNVLISRIKSGKYLDTSYLISGPHGSGKTTLARIYARAMLCDDHQEGEPCNICKSCKQFLKEEHLNFEERDAAGHGTIDWVRSIVDNLSFSLFQGQKIILFDESHRMSRDSQDVLLKPIEDRKLTCIFCTTELRKMRPAIRSRCESLQLEKISSTLIVDRLKLICNAEQINCEEKALEWIVDYSNGHVRDAISALDQVSQVGSVTTDNVKRYLNVGWSTEVLCLIQSVLSDDRTKTMSLTNGLIYKLPPQDIYTNILENLIHLMYMKKSLPVPNSFDLELGSAILGKFDIGLIHSFMSKFNRSIRYLDKYMLICEMMLILEKLHRGFEEACMVDRSLSKPKSKPKSFPTSSGDKNDPETLTPIDYAGINPKIRDDGYDPFKSVSVAKLDRNIDSLDMSPKEFMNRFNMLRGK